MKLDFEDERLPLKKKAHFDLDEGDLEAVLGVYLEAENPTPQGFERRFTIYLPDRPGGTISVYVEDVEILK